MCACVSLGPLFHSKWACFRSQVLDWEKNKIACWSKYIMISIENEKSVTLRGELDQAVAWGELAWCNDSFFELECIPNSKAPFLHKSICWKYFDRFYSWLAVAPRSPAATLQEKRNKEPTCQQIYETNSILPATNYPSRWGCFEICVR